jgi:outer membrane protein insertion porin family
MHEFAYEGVVRHLASLTPSASLSIREAAGFSTKSSISHTFVLDTRQDKVFTTRMDKLTSFTSPGTYLKLYQELAGIGLLGGDAKFYKGEIEAKSGFGIAKGAVSRVRSPALTLILTLTTDAIPRSSFRSSLGFR